jgi:elongation factor Ts
MAQISPALVKALREETLQGMMECKKALEEAGGDLEKAKDILRKKGLKTAEKRAGRSTSQGLIGSYVHFNGQVGVLVEVNCESDFVANSDAFKEFARDVAMQVASGRPMVVTREEVPAAMVAREKDILAEEVKKLPEKARDKAMEGKLVKGFYALHVLLDQPFVKDDKRTVGDLLNALIAKTGENCRIRRFVRVQLGEE